MSRSYEIVARIATFMYKTKHGLAPGTVSELFSCKNSNYLLRYGDFNIPRIETVCYGKHSMRHLGPSIWSKLDAEVIASANLSSFKNNIRNVDLASLLDNNSNCCKLCSS